MTGMNEVGRLFNNNELIVAEVLQSAEAMKAAVSHLEKGSHVVVGNQLYGRSLQLFSNELPRFGVSTGNVEL